MMPHCKRDSQFELFEAQPHEARHAPPLTLPIQRSAEIDVARVGRILDVSKQTVQRMLKRKLFRAYKVGTSAWRIEYDSVVEYCNHLRLTYRISTQVLRKSSGMRFRDSELLPFPSDQTIGIADVERALDCSYEKVTHLIQEGELIAYQILPHTKSCPWRIYRPSLDRYVASLHVAAQPAPRSRLAPSSL